LFIRAFAWSVIFERGSHSSFLFFVSVVSLREKKEMKAHAEPLYFNGHGPGVTFGLSSTR
jgi:hypothetical protein